MKKNNTHYTKYSDHNAIVINIDFVSLKDVSRKKKVVTRKGYKKYQTIIQEKETKY